MTGKRHPTTPSTPGRHVLTRFCDECRAPVADHDEVLCPECKEGDLPDPWDLVQHPGNYDMEADRRRKQTRRGP